MEHDFMSKSNPTICFAASSGGHYEQLMALEPLMHCYNSFVLTEHTHYQSKLREERTYFVPQVNRKEWSMPFRLIANVAESLAIFIKERPDIVITTGALAVIPMCMLAKLFGRKLVYIESFAKISSPTETGRLLYRFADRFYVQWDSMKEFYPKAMCVGSIY